jgi:hypothetical protein
MKSITSDELRSHIGGATYIECFFAGALFGAAIATGQIIGAAGAGFYIAANCLN